MYDKSEYCGVDLYQGEHEDAIWNIVRHLLELHTIKSKTYLDSWASDGILATYFTIKRPWTRIQNIITSNDSNNLGNYIFTLVFFEACVDLALYVLKWAAVIIQHNPSIMDEWVKKEHIELKPDEYELVMHPMKVAEIDPVMKKTLEDGATRMLSDIFQSIKHGNDD